jgi:hypothetical protein
VRLGRCQCSEVWRTGAHGEAGPQLAGAIVDDERACRVAVRCIRGRIERLGRLRRGESALGHGHGLLRREAGQVRPRLDAGLGARQFGTHDVTDARASGERAVEELHRADGRAGKEAKSGQVRGR